MCNSKVQCDFKSGKFKCISKPLNPFSHLNYFLSFPDAKFIWVFFEKPLGIFSEGPLNVNVQIYNVYLLFLWVVYIFFPEDQNLYDLYLWSIKVEMQFYYIFHQNEERYNGRLGFGGTAPCAQTNGSQIFIDKVRKT